MKIKLLKKVRKRFEIYYHPKGIMWSNTYYEGVYYTLYDNKTGREYLAALTKRNIATFQCDSDDECVNILKKKIILILKAEGYSNKKRNEIVQKKVWYV